MIAQIFLEQAIRQYVAIARAVGFKIKRCSTYDPAPDRACCALGAVKALEGGSHTVACGAALGMSGAESWAFASGFDGFERGHYGHDWPDEEPNHFGVDFCYDLGKRLGEELCPDQVVD